MSNLFYHKDLTKVQWNKIKFIFEKQNKKSGVRWRPPHFGKWNSVYHTFRRWAKQGIFEKILQIVNKSSENTRLI